MASASASTSSSHVPFPSYDEHAYAYGEEADRHAYQDHAAPPFSCLLTSVLGSPFLTTSELPEDADTAYAPSIPMDTMDLDGDADNGADMEDVDGAFASVPRSFTVTRPPSPTPSFRTETFSIVNWNPELYNLMLPNADGTPRCSMGFLPSGRRTVAGYPSAHWIPHSASSPSPMKPSRSLTMGMNILPRIWDALREGSPVKKGRRRPGMPAWRDAGTDLEYHSDGSVDYANMLPLDGEEGELIDDEACFIDVRAITGMGKCPAIFCTGLHRAQRRSADMISHLPLELSLELLSYLDLPSILACLRVSRCVYLPLPADLVLIMRQNLEPPCP